MVDINELVERLFAAANKGPASLQDFFNAEIGANTELFGQLSQRTASRDRRTFGSLRAARCAFTLITTYDSFTATEEQITAVAAEHSSDIDKLRRSYEGGDFDAFVRDRIVGHLRSLALGAHIRNADSDDLHRIKTQLISSQRRDVCEATPWEPVSYFHVVTPDGTAKSQYGRMSDVHGSTPIAIFA